MPGNVDQIALWNGPSGETWVAMQERLDRQLFPLGRVAMDALAVRPGERVVDIGCGSGQTTIELAARVGSAGRVVGVDISEPLLALARRRAPDLAFVAADAQRHRFEPADAAFSRFGVMFFTDPVAAFTNLASAVRRLAFVCWRRAEENPMMTVPIAAAVAAGLPAPESPPPDAPGPFAFADRDRVAQILAAAGFDEIEIVAHDEPIGGSDLDASVDLAFHVGPLARQLREHPALRASVTDAVRAAIASYVTDGLVAMPSATWIVTARRPI